MSKICPGSGSGSKKRITSSRGTSSTRYTRVPQVPISQPFEEKVGVGVHDMDYAKTKKNYGIEEKNELDAINLDEDDENIGETPVVGNANVRFESINRPARAPRARRPTSIA